MASTPSASALTAVLRCRGNILTRNPPTKRPSTSAYSLALTRGSPAERSRSNQALAWEAFLQGDRVLVGRRLAVAYRSPRVEGKTPGGKDSRETNKLCHPKLSQSALDPHSAVRGVQNALARQLTRRPSSWLPRIEKCSQIKQKIKYETCAICKIVFGENTGEFTVLKVSITSPCLLESAGQIPSIVFTGWSTAKSTCLSLAALVSECTGMCLELAVLWRSSSSSSPRDAQHQTTRDKALQANGQTHNPIDLTCSKESSDSGQMIPEDRPD
ncbi:hypothetical protein VZT92_027701 [Zoarces viviparus]|uniref:Uncharacterized protein n=1 Tax=Zoarces viviparus TaxID=48416 RepID=A0AAW1DVZ2_ZOAVI